jgi:hypothetical protein
VKNGWTRREFLRTGGAAVLGLGLANLGACGSVLMYSPSRVLYPLRRVGERGEGNVVE